HTALASYITSLDVTQYLDRTVRNRPRPSLSQIPSNGGFGRGKFARKTAMELVAERQQSAQLQLIPDGPVSAPWVPLACPQPNTLTSSSCKPRTRTRRKA